MTSILDAINSGGGGMMGQAAQQPQSFGPRRPARIINLDKYRARLDELSPETLKDMLLFVGSRLISPKEFEAMLDEFASKEQAEAETQGDENVGATTGAASSGA